MLFTILLSVAGGLLVSRLATPTYSVESRLLLDPPQAIISEVKTNDPLNNLFLPVAGHDIGTQILMLQSTPVLAHSYSQIGIAPDAVQVRIYRVGETDVVGINAESAYPQLAEQIARQVPISYRAFLFSNRKSESAEALTRARAALERQSQQQLEIEREMERFRNEAGTPRIETEIEHRCSLQEQLQAQLFQAEQDQAKAEAALRRAQQSRAEQSDRRCAVVTTLSGAARATVAQEIARLQVERELGLNLYTPTSFPIRQFDALLAAEQEQMAAIPDRQTVSTETENPELPFYQHNLEEAQTRLEAAQAAGRQAKQAMKLCAAQLERDGALLVRWLHLRQQLRSQEEDAITLRRAVDRLEMRDRLMHDPVMLISEAGKAKPVVARKLDALGSGLLGGLILGLGLALLIELYDTRLHTPEEVLEQVEAPPLGYVPLIPNREPRLVSEVHSGSLVLESYRTLRANVEFALVGMGVRSLAVTSTIPDEGKSLTATNLAIMLALDGKRVILVDADLRRPALHRTFQTPQSPGLSQVLLGELALGGALRETYLPHLYLMTSGPLPPNPAELLNSPGMKALHRQLLERADVVIYDSPPCLAGADALVLSGVAESVLYVVQLGEVRRSGLRHALELLEPADAPMLGIVFNKVKRDRDLELYRSAEFRNYVLTVGEAPRRRTRLEFEQLVYETESEASEETEGSSDELAHDRD